MINESTGFLNAGRLATMLCAASVVFAMTPNVSQAACTLPGCHGREGAAASAVHRNAYGDPGGSALEAYSGDYRGSVSNSSELQTIATSAAIGKNPYADDLARMGYGQSGLYSGMGGGSKSSFHSSMRANVPNPVANMLPAIQGLAAGIPGATSRLGR